MRKNFKVGQSNEILSETGVNDLHNEYDFLGLSLGLNGDLRMRFRPHESHRIGKPEIVLSFAGVDFLEVLPGRGPGLSADLEEIGYLPQDSPDEGWLLDEEQALPDSHLLFRMGSGCVRVHAREAYLSVARL